MAYCDTFEPLRVTARFRGNVVCDEWLPLDGILWFQAHRLALGPQQATLPGGNPGARRKGVHMPLKIIGHGTPDWHFACSWAQPQPWWVEEGTDHWNKRFDSRFVDLMDFGRRRGKVITEQGKYRAYHMPLFYRTARRVHWYCVGDKVELKALLSMVTHIGKKPAQGWGRVVWTVESWHSDWSVWRDGAFTRGVPKAAALNMIQERGGQVRAFDFVNYGVRPSYYRPANQRELAVSR
jgi:hypothetical protein